MSRIIWLVLITVFIFYLGVDIISGFIILSIGAIMIWREITRLQHKKTTQNIIDSVQSVEVKAKVSSIINETYYKYTKDIRVEKRRDAKCANY